MKVVTEAGNGTGEATTFVKNQLVIAVPKGPGRNNRAGTVTQLGLPVMTAQPPVLSGGRPRGSLSQVDDVPAPAAVAGGEGRSLTLVIVYRGRGGKGIDA